MLMSHSILRDVSFLSSKDKTNHDLRIKVLRSTKIIVGNEFFIFKSEEGHTDHKAFVMDLLNVSKESGLNSALLKHQKLWDKYAWPAYDCLFIENENSAFLIEKESNDYFVVTPMYRWGSKAVSGSSLIMARAKTGEISMLDLAMDELSKTRGIQAMRATEKYADDAAALDAFERMMETITTTYMVSSLEILLFLNAKNACLSPCIPTKKEMAKVPKVFQPYYTYLVLDVYRERDSYASLEEAMDHLNEHQSMKHLVRGRCVDTRHGLFWRPAKNTSAVEAANKAAS